MIMSLSHFCSYTRPHALAMHNTLDSYLYPRPNYIVGHYKDLLLRNFHFAVVLHKNIDANVAALTVFNYTTSRSNYKSDLAVSILPAAFPKIHAVLGSRYVSR